MPLLGLVNARGEPLEIDEVIASLGPQGSWKFGDWGLPPTLVAAACRVKMTYKDTGVFASATQLKTPPKIFWATSFGSTYEWPGHEGNVASTVGTTVHGAYEGEIDSICASRFRVEDAWVLDLAVPGYPRPVRIGACIDLLDTRDPENGEDAPATIHDYKVTKSYKIRAMSNEAPGCWEPPHGINSDWAFQQNVYALVLGSPDRVKVTDKGLATEPAGSPVKVGRVLLTAVARDYRDNSGTGGSGPVSTHPIPLWGHGHTLALVQSKLKALLDTEPSDEDKRVLGAAKFLQTPGDSGDWSGRIDPDSGVTEPEVREAIGRLPACTDEDMWTPRNLEAKMQYSWWSRSKVSASVSGPGFEGLARALEDHLRGHAAAAMGRARTKPSGDVATNVDLILEPPIPKRCGRWCPLAPFCDQGRGAAARAGDQNFLQEELAKAAETVGASTLLSILKRQRASAQAEEEACAASEWESGSDPSPSPSPSPGPDPTGYDPTLDSWF